MSPSVDIEALYRDQQRLLVSVAWRILRSMDDAREVCQEAFARLLASVKDGAEIRNAPAWLCRTAVNLSIERVRRRPPPVRPAAPAAPAADADSRRLLDDAIEALPERQRVVFLLRHEQGMPLTQIAETLGIAPSTAGVHLTRALRALRDRLATRMEDLR
ncbi:MAG: sigma-70 family RNA polymerase sigma factor [Planctomycetia bacterium]|nr:sigma-70 family RNA polymerase sigma factor [Planctomycetia bacterium]